MAHIPFAFSIHHFVNSVGSYAGFASIIGLAILVLLYFAQARETSTLRDRADGAEQHAAQLEARLAQASRAPAVRPVSGVAQRPVPSARPLVNPVAAGAGIAPQAPGGQHAAMPASAGAGGAQAVVGAGAALPAAPAGVGAPALSAATRLIPAPVAAQQLASAASSAPPATASPPSPPSPPPATVAGGAPLSNGPGGATNGTSEEAAVALADAAPVAAHASLEPGPLALTPPEPAPEPLPRVQLRQGAASQTRPAAPSLRRPAPRRAPSRIGRGVVLLLTALAVAVVVVVLLIVTSGGGGKTASTGGTQTTNAPSARHRAKAKSFNTSAVTVAVLNGTATAGAAARLSGQLAGSGYKRGPTTNAANQTQTSTVVMYLAGHRNGAVAVARALKLPSSSVQAIDSQTQAIACPSATSCAVDVVVTVGQDLAGK